jgi:hypothetical protein
VEKSLNHTSLPSFTHSRFWRGRRMTRRERRQGKEGEKEEERKKLMLSPAR